MGATKKIESSPLGGLLQETVFTVFDVETTGLSPERNRMTEMGIVKIKSGEVIDEYSTLINPEQFIPPEI
ncbi:partial DNA polymerase III subunit epsilon, partial [uncultured bacterium]